jgi:ankyrin repeat protein
LNAADAHPEVSGLHWTVQVMGILMVASVDEINALGSQGYNALHFAAKQGHEKIIRLIVSAKTDVEAQSGDGQRPLSIAAHFGQLEAVRVLVELGADVEVGQAGKLALRPLHEAAKRGHLEVVKALVEFGADLTATSCHGATALHAAVQEGCTEVVKALVAAGADLEARLSARLYSYTPLMYAVGRANPSPETVKVLVELGANVDALDASGHTAMEISNMQHKHQPAVARAMASALQTLPVARSTLHVPTAEEVRAMSVKELKAHLTRLHTDHSLCVEKSELVALLCAVSLAAAGQAPPVARPCGASSNDTAAGVAAAVQVVLPTVEEAHAMTVRQLETQLAAAGVDYSAALEKSELVELCLLSQVTLN